MVKCPYCNSINTECMEHTSNTPTEDVFTYACHMCEKSFMVVFRLYCVITDDGVEHIVRHSKKRVKTNEG